MSVKRGDKPMIVEFDQCACEHQRVNNTILAASVDEDAVTFENHPPRRVEGGYEVPQFGRVTLDDAEEIQNQATRRNRQ